MAKWRAQLVDGRTLEVYAPDEAQAMAQANHAETTRVIILGKRDLPIKPLASSAVGVTRIKD